jgi:multidrug resistance efflux pump
MHEAIQGRDSLVDQMQKLEQRKAQYQEDNEKIHSNKRSLKTLFKSSAVNQEEVQNIKNNIELVERSISQYRKIINIINLYLAEVAIPQFKEDKLTTYYKIFSAFSAKEIKDAHLDVTFWTNVLNIVTQFGF